MVTGPRIETFCLPGILETAKDVAVRVENAERRYLGNRQALLPARFGSSAAGSNTDGASASLLSRMGGGDADIWAHALRGARCILSYGRVPCLPTARGNKNVSTPARQAHWQNVYQTKGERDVSWFQESPAISLDLIRASGIGNDATIVDIGGGTSRLVDALIAEGFKSVTVLDLSDKALATARTRLGALGAHVGWVAADVTTWQPVQTYDLWHDRAAFHFLTEPGDQAAYADCCAKPFARAATSLLERLRLMDRSVAAACRSSVTTPGRSARCSAHPSSLSRAAATIIKRRPEPFSDSSSAALCAKRSSDATEVRSCSAYPAVDDPARACGSVERWSAARQKRHLRQASSVGIARGEDSC